MFFARKPPGDRYLRPIHPVRRLAVGQRRAHSQGLMPQFDPRMAPTRYAPALLGGAAVAFSAMIGAGVAAMLHSPPAVGPEAPNVAKMQALEPQAIAEQQLRPGLSTPKAVPVKILPGETFESAVRRTGVAEGEARAIVQALARGFDTVNIKAGLAFQAVVAHPRGRGGPAHLIGLSMQTGPASTLTLSRTFDGALRLRELEEKVREETTVAQGKMEGSLYESALKAGADSRMVSQAAKLFAAKLDFSRDIKADDQFRLVFDRKVTESGKTVETGDLLYAEIGAKGQTTRFYRFDSKSGPAQFFDETGKNIRGFLLRTPVDGARITSRFGARRHPILGYTRMHQGIDFGAGRGTPILSAGAGVISFEGRAGGYGNQVRVKHQGGWETSYSHMSRFAKGLKRGSRVAQGQVIGYVGSTGLATGPHLHYEISMNGRKTNPIGAKVPQGNILAGSELAAFKAQKAHIDAVLAQAAKREDAPQQLASLSLRPAVR
jgi:murein DD-endopeptidase MepM/ murein hydrolase activator NlpD